MPGGRARAARDSKASRGRAAASCSEASGATGRAFRLRGRPAAAAPSSASLIPTSCGPVFDEHGRVVGVGEQLVGELRRELGFLLVERAQPRLVGARSSCAPARTKRLSYRSSRYFGSSPSPSAIAPVVEGLDAREELRVQVDRVVMRGVERRDLGPDLLKGLARVRLRQVRRRPCRRV